MIDRLFTATLTFFMLIGSTLAIGSEMFGIDLNAAAQQTAAAPVQVVHLERVVIVAKRLAPATTVAQNVSESAARVQ